MRSALVVLAAALLAACAPVAQPPPTGAPPTATPAPSPPTAAPATTEPPAPPPPTAAPITPTAAPVTPTAAPAGPTLEATLGYGEARAAAFVPGTEAVAVATEAGVLVMDLPDLTTQAFIALPAGAHQVDVSPDGRTIAAGTFISSVSGGMRTTLISGGAVVRELPGTQPRFSPDGAALAVAELDNTTGCFTTRLFAVADGAELAAVAGEAPSFSPDGRLLVTRDREITVVSARDGAELLREPAFLADFDPGGATLALSGPSGIHLIPVRDGALDLPARRVLAPAGARAMAFDAAGRLVAFTEAGLVRWGQGAPGEPELLRPGMDAAIPTFGPSAVLVALTQPISDAPSPLALMRAEDGRLVYEEVELEGGTPAFSADGRRAAVVTGAGDLRLVDAETGQLAERHLPGYTVAALGADGAAVAGRPGPQVDHFARLADERPARRLGAYAFWQQPRDLRVTDDGAITAEIESSSFGYTMGFAVARWEGGAPEGEPATLETLDDSLAIPQPAVWDYAPAPGLLAYTDELSLVRIRGDGEEPRELPAIRGVPAAAIASALAFSPDGSHLAVGYGDGTVAVVETAGFGTVLAGPLGEGTAIVALAWSADGRLLGLGLAGGRALAVQVGEDEPPAPAGGLPEGNPTTLAFSPDGALLAVAGTAGLAVAEVGGAEVLARAGPTSDVAFAPDGGRLAAVRQGRVEVWAVR